MLRFGNLLVNERNVVTVSLTDRGVILQLNVAAQVQQSLDEDPRLVVLDSPEGAAARWHFIQKYPDLAAAAG